METTTEKLQKIIETKEAIKEAIKEKGVEVKDGDPFEFYPEKIEAIKAGSPDGCVLLNREYMSKFVSYLGDIGKDDNIIYDFQGTNFDLSLSTSSYDDYLPAVQDRFFTNRNIRVYNALNMFKDKLLFVRRECLNPENRVTEFFYNDFSGLDFKDCVVCNGLFEETTAGTFLEDGRRAYYSQHSTQAFKLKLGEIEDFEIPNGVFDFSSALFVSSMFKRCELFPVLDFRNFTFGDSVIESEDFLYYCQSLKIICENMPNFCTLEGWRYPNVLGTYVTYAQWVVCNPYDRGVIPSSLFDQVETLKFEGEKIVKLDMGGHPVSCINGGNHTLRLDISSIFYQSATNKKFDWTYGEMFEFFANSLGPRPENEREGGIIDFKISNALYETLTEEQKALITDKGYSLSC